MKKNLAFIFLIFFFSFQVQSIEPKNNKHSIFNVVISEYMKVTMKEHNQPLSNEKIKDFNYESALAYAKYLNNWFELNKDKKVRKRNITFHEAVLIYKSVFEKLKIPYDAWFFTDIYDSLNEIEREKIWNEMISNPEMKSEMIIFIELWGRMKDTSGIKSNEINEKRKRWLGRMKKIELVIEIEKTMKKIDEDFYYKK